MTAFEIQASIDKIKTYKQLKYPNIYELRHIIPESGKPLVFAFFGPSTVGKDTLLAPVEDLSFVNTVTTATTRSRRPEEPENDYIWLPSHNTDDTPEGYVARLVHEYHLIEWDIHDGHLYGLPFNSVMNTLSKGAAVIRTNYKAIEDIRTHLESYATVIAISIHPENWQELQKRIESLRDNADLRITESQESLINTENIADYVIFNPFNEGALKDTQQQLVSFVKEKYAETTQKYHMAKRVLGAKKKISEEY